MTLILAVAWGYAIPQATAGYRICLPGGVG